MSLTLAEPILIEGALGEWDIRSEVLGALLVRDGRSLSVDILERKFGYSENQIKKLVRSNSIGARPFATRYVDDRLTSVSLNESQVTGLRKHGMFVKFMLEFKKRMSAHRSRFEWLKTKMGSDPDLAAVVNDVKEKKKKRKGSSPFIRS